MPTAGLPPVVLPRKLGGAARTASPSSGLESGSALARDSLNRANTPLANYRQTRSAPELMRYLAAGNALASTALLNMVALANTKMEFRVYDGLTQEFSRPGLLALEQILSAIDCVQDYTRGYSDKRTMASLTETALREVGLTGGVVLELVLDKYRLPDQLVLAPYDEISWSADGKGGVYPVQKPKTGKEVPLNYPNVFIAEGFKSAAERYSTPFSASGAQSLFQFEDFVQDAWRTIRRAGEPRLTASLNYEQVVRSAPPEVQNDPKKLADYLESARSEIETLLTGLNPEDALVSFDLITMDKIDATGAKKDFADLMQVYSGMAASALKSNASLMGLRMGGSQNVASTEALLSTTVARLLQIPVEAVFSRALTLAVRLLGLDCYVEAHFSSIELRPESELEAFSAMKQNRVLELLSLGLITDEEAQNQLGLGSRPAAAQDLSGTGFYDTKPLAALPTSGKGALGQNIGKAENTSAGGKDQSQTP